MLPLFLKDRKQAKANLFASYRFVLAIYSLFMSCFALVHQNSVKYKSSLFYVFRLYFVSALEW